MRGSIIKAKSVLRCVILLNIIYVGKATQGPAEGYYWRDFNGIIPGDALPGGRDGNRNPIYIGQVLYDVYLVPAKIYGDGRVYFEYGQVEHTATKNIKILCTQHPQQFEWISTSNENIKFLADNLVIGGYDKPDTTTYIGRVRAGGEVAVGKVLDDIAEIYRGLHITRDGKGERHVTFQVLAFNPNLRNNSQ